MSGVGGLWSRFLESSWQNMDLDYAARNWLRRMALTLPWLGAAFAAGMVVYFVLGA